MALGSDKKLDALVQELTTWDKDLEPLRETMRLMWGEWTPSPPGAAEENPKNPFLSKVRIPWGHNAVETIVPRVVGFEPTIAYRALDDSDDIPIAHLMGGLVGWQLERMGFEYETRSFIRQGLIVGYTVAKIGWVKEELEIETEEESIVQALGAIFRLKRPKKQTVTVRNAPFFETVDVAGGDFVWPQLAKSIDDASAVWQRRWVTIGHLEEHADVYKDIDKIAHNAAGRYRDARRARADQQGATLSAGPDEGADRSEWIVELWERWTDDYLCAIANPLTDPVKLREDENPFHHGRKPYGDWSPVPHPFQMHGLGVIQTIYDQNEALNTLHRQVSDCLTYQLNPAFKSRGGLGSQLSLFPGKNVDLDELEDIEPLNMPQVDLGAALAWVQGIKEDMQRTTGAFDWLAGAPSRSSQTATEIATISEEGNKRISEMIQVFDERTMKRFGHLLAMMNAQYVDSSVVADFSDDPAAAQAWAELAGAEAAVAQEGPVPLSPEMVKAKGRLEPLPQVGQDKMLSDIQKRSDATQAMQALAPLLSIPSVGMTVDFVALASWMLEQFGVDKMTRQKILSANPQQIQAMVAQQALENTSNATPPGEESGPSGENAPTGDVVGAAGAAGPIGPFGQAAA